MSWLDYHSYSWPGLILTIYAFVVVTYLLGTFIGGLMSHRRRYAGKHVIITGGSQGFGLELAKLFAADGANVSIIARNQGILNAAVDSINACRQNPQAQKVAAFSADVSDFQAVSAAVHRAEEALGVVEVVIANAGLAVPGYFAEQDVTAFQQQMNINYFGCVNLAKATVPRLIARRQGQLVFVSSFMGVAGMIGYSSYAPTKWAVRGLADCLRQELLPFSIDVSCVYLTDVMTPGYDTENKSKPVETKEISGGAPPMSPTGAAVEIFKGIRLGDYHICNDVGAGLIIRSMAALVPRSNAVLDFVLAPVLVVLTQFLGKDWDKTVLKHGARRPDGVARMGNH